MTRDEYGTAYEAGFKQTVGFLRSRGVGELAQEIAQAAWAQGWERIRQLRDARHVEDWVRGIALNMVRDYRRRNGRLCSLGTEHDRAAASHSDARLIDLDQSVRRSAPKQGKLLRLHLAGYSAEEIADIFSVSSGVVQARLYRARRSLRKQLKAA